MKKNRTSIYFVLLLVALLASCGKPKNKYEQVEMPTELMDYFAATKEGTYWIFEDDAGNVDSLSVASAKRYYEYDEEEEKKYWIYYTTINSEIRFASPSQMVAETKYYQRLQRDERQEDIEFRMSDNSSGATLNFKEDGTVISDTSKYRYERLDSITLNNETFYNIIRVYVAFSKDRYYTFAKGIGCIERVLHPSGFHFKVKRYHIVR